MKKRMEKAAIGRSKIILHKGGNQALLRDEDEKAFLKYFRENRPKSEAHDSLKRSFNLSYVIYSKDLYEFLSLSHKDFILIRYAL